MFEAKAKVKCKDCKCEAKTKDLEPKAKDTVNCKLALRLIQAKAMPQGLPSLKIYCNIYSICVLCMCLPDFADVK